MRFVINRRYILLVIFAVFTVIVSGCDEKELLQSEEWVNTLSNHRAKAESHVPTVPYRLEQNESFRKYFGELAKVAFEVTRDSNQSKKLNAFIEKVNLETFCSRVFVKKITWEILRVNCARQGYFVCTEEVRSYVDIVTSLRAHLKPAQQQRFDSAPACRNVME